MGELPAARVTDPFGHSCAMTGVLTGLAIGALAAVFIIGTGGLGAIAVGAAIATTGAAGLAGQAIGQTIDGDETGVLEHGSTNVRINGLFATMVMIGTGDCSRDSGPPVKVASGSATVKINGQLAARVSEKMDCSAVIRKGSPDVNIGGPSQQVLAITPDVPSWLTTTMTAMAIGGTIIATGGIAATYGIGAAAGSLIGGVGGSYLGGKGATMAAAALGFGATGQAIAGVGGSFLGGALGGGAGFKGGAAAEGALGSARSVPGLPGDTAPAAAGAAADEAAAGATPGTTPKDYGVAFFGDSNKPYYEAPNATLGRTGRSFFMMPIEDSPVVTDAASAARYTGMSPSTMEAYQNGGDIYGISFPTEGMQPRAPTAADAGGWEHFLEGGHTAVRTAGPNGGYLVNPTREFVVPGGTAVPPGSTLFKLGPDGEWIPLRHF